MSKLISPPDQHQRDMALDIHSSFVVRAPAGSGKTTLLVARYLHLLSVVANPEEILAITFTRKAAAEMRARVIEKLIQGDDKYSLAARAADKNNQWQLLENPNRLKIQTIDSFNSTLANSFPLQSQLSPDLNVSDSSQQLYELAVQRLFDKLYTRSDKSELFQAQTEIIADLLAILGNDFSRAGRMLVKMMSKRDQWLEHTAHILTNVLSSGLTEEQAINGLFEKNVAQLNARSTALFLDRLSLAEQNELGALFQYSQANLNANKSEKTGAEVLEFQRNGLPLVPHQWRALGELLTTAKHLARKTVTVAQGFPPGAGEKREMKNRMIEFLRNCIVDLPDLKNLRLIPDITASTEEAHHLFTLCAGLSLSALELQRVFTDEGKIDYTQMSIAALQALGDADNITDIALTLDYRIKHLLIDEYQDTSWFQNELLLRLTREWQSDQGRSFFAVGDPMQSIYRFRDADVALFMRSTHMQFGTLSPEAVVLTANFRSSPELVDWFNRVFTHSFGSFADSNLGKVPYQNADNARPDLANKNDPCVTLDLFSGDGAKTSEAEFISQKISKLQATTPNANIALLVRSRAHTNEVIGQLDAHHIAWQGTDIDSLKEEPAVMDLLTIIKMLWQHDSIIPCLAFFRSPMLGIELPDLLILSQYIHQQALSGSKPIESLIGIDTYLTNPSLSSRARKALSRNITSLANARHKIGKVLPRQILEQLWIRLGGYEIYTSYRARTACTRLLDLVEKQAEWGSLYELDIQELELQVDALYQENAPVEGAVQVMTIHKSKGLQFDHVFLPSLASTTRSRDKELLRWRLDGDALLMASSLSNGPGSLYAWLDAEDAEREANETRRLLYVACTRACLSLHLSACMEPDKAPTKNSLLAPIWACVKEEAIWHEQGKSNADVDEALPGITAPSAVQYWRLPEAWQWQLPPGTPANLFLGNRTADSESVRLEDGRTSPEGPEIVLGLLVHEILHDISLKFPSKHEQYIQTHTHTWRSRLIMLSSLQSDKNLDIDCLLERVLSQITAILEDPDGQWLLRSHHEESLSEAPFTGYYNGSLVNVVVDRTFVDDTGTRWIIDYKSSLKPEDMDADSFVKQHVQWHTPQLRKYSALLSSWKPGPVKTALYFTDLPQLRVLESIP